MGEPTEPTANPDDQSTELENELISRLGRVTDEELLQLRKNVTTQRLLFFDELSRDEKARLYI